MQGYNETVAIVIEQEEITPESASPLLNRQGNHLGGTCTAIFSLKNAKFLASKLVFPAMGSTDGISYGSELAKRFNQSNTSATSLIPGVISCLGHASLNSSAISETIENWGSKSRAEKVGLGFPGLIAAIPGGYFTYKGMMDLSSSSSMIAPAIILGVSNTLCEGGCNILGIGGGVRVYKDAFGVTTNRRTNSRCKKICYVVLTTVIGLSIAMGISNADTREKSLYLKALMGVAAIPMGLLVSAELYEGINPEKVEKEGVQCRNITQNSRMNLLPIAIISLATTVTMTAPAANLISDYFCEGHHTRYGFNGGSCETATVVGSFLWPIFAIAAGPIFVSRVSGMVNSICSCIGDALAYCRSDPRYVNIEGGP